MATGFLVAFAIERSEGCFSFCMVKIEVLMGEKNGADGELLLQRERKSLLS